MHHHRLTQEELRNDEYWFRHHNRYNHHHQDDIFTMMLCDEKSNKTIMPVLMIIVFLIVPILAIDLTGIIKSSQNLDEINKACGGSALFIFIIVHSIFNLLLFFGYLFIVILNNSEEQEEDQQGGIYNIVPKFTLVIVSLVVHIIWVSAAIIVIITSIQSHDKCASVSVWLCATGYTNLTVNALNVCFSFLACLCYFPEHMTQHHGTPNEKGHDEETKDLIVAKEKQHPTPKKVNVAPHPTAGPTSSPHSASHPD